MVGDRGMISHKAVAQLREQGDVGSITALKSIFDPHASSSKVTCNWICSTSAISLAGATRIIPVSAWSRAAIRRSRSFAPHKREDMLAATEKNLKKVQSAVAAGRLKGQDEIGVRVGKVVNQYKMAKHFGLDIKDRSFVFHRKRESIDAEAGLDGLYIIRTSVPADQMDSAECVRRYKSLAQVERAFRSLKTVDLKVRPIHHRLADRVRAHIFLCMLAYYVEWHMREAWRELMFADEDQQAKLTRDPVAPAKRSAAAELKALTHTLEDGTAAHSLSTLLAELGAIVRNTCRMPNAELAPSFQITTTANPTQHRALELIRQMPV